MSITGIVWRAAWLSKAGNTSDDGFDVGLLISDEQWGRADKCDNNFPDIAVFDAVAPELPGLGRSPQQASPVRMS